MTATGKQWIRIDLWHTTITLAIQNGSVVWVPRDARWALGKPEQLVADHYRREGAQFARLKLTRRNLHHHVSTDDGC